MNYIALRVSLIDADLDKIQNEKLFILIKTYDTDSFLFLIEKTPIERLYKINKITKRDNKRLQNIIDIINKYSFATVNDNWNWTIKHYEIK
jgi:hypothetical protein